MAQPSHLPAQSPDAPPRFTTIATDWHGAALEAQPSFRIVVDPGTPGGGQLEFLATARKSPSSAIGSQAGEFHEGLWQHDCAELFLLQPATGHYMEFNLSPNGAWWSCLFEAPRRQALIENLPLPGVFAEGLEGIAHWEARLRIPLASLPESIGSDPRQWLGNATFCLGNAPRQKFATFAHPAAGLPDFHRPQDWLPLGPV